MTSFKDFHKELEKLSVNSNKVFDLASSTAACVTNVLSPLTGVLSVFDNTKKVEKFSKEVAEAAVSDDVISAVSQQVGEPKKNETEEEFVERTSHILREILKKKFNV